MSTDKVEDLYYTHRRIPVLLYKAQDQIWQNAVEINTLLHTLISEKFGPKNTCDTAVT